MSTELTKIVLVGSLGKAVGRSEWHLDVKSPAEALRAIDVNTRGALFTYLGGPARERLYRVALQKRDNVIDTKEVGNRSGRATVYIMPTIKGRNSGVGKIIAGALLIIAAVITQQYYLLGALTTATGGLTLAGYAVLTATSFGISLVLGGISQLLTPGAQTPGAQQNSTVFPGNNAAVTQGSCIPVVYGHALVSPIPISITQSNNDVSTSAAGTLGGVDTTPLLGGGSQFNPTILPN